jgi:hypothetical protein
MEGAPWSRTVQGELAATGAVPRRQRPPCRLESMVLVPTRGRACRTPCKRWARDGAWARHGEMLMVGGLMARMLRVVMVLRYLLLGGAYGW